MVISYHLKEWIMKKLFLLLFLLGCAEDEYREIHTVSFNGQPAIVETSSGSYRNSGNLAVRGHFGRGGNGGSIFYNTNNRPYHRSYPQTSNYVQYSDGNTTITRGTYITNCEKIIHRRGRSYVVPCDY